MFVIVYVCVCVIVLFYEHMCACTSETVFKQKRVLYIVLIIQIKEYAATRMR